jgi:hypothetical protein
MDAPDVIAVHIGGSGRRSPNSFPCGSLQVENQPMLGTGAGSFASPPSSFTRAAPALMSSTAKYGRVPRLPHVGDRRAAFSLAPRIRAPALGPRAPRHRPPRHLARRVHGGYAVAAFIDT